MARYVVVDQATKKILGGPYVWDGTTDWSPPMAGTLMLESAAASGGYTSNVVVDPADVLRAKIPAALVANSAYLALATPTNAQVVQQVQRLTRQMNAVGRLVAQLLDDTSDT